MKVVSAACVLTFLASHGANAVVSQWGQCGGINWTGETVCESPGLVCTKLNDWYYQCLTSSSTTSSTKSSSTPQTTSSTTTSTLTSSTTPCCTQTLTPLNDLIVTKGKSYFGVAVDTNELANATYAVNLVNKHLFGQITPGNKMKWDATEPSQGTFTYAKADAIVSWAQANEQEIRGHTLVWYNQLPAWVTSGSFANATLVSIMENHVTNLVTHFKGSVKTWDVTNEIFQDDGTWRASVFYTTIGEYFVDIAFRAAAAADPDVGLAANDYNLESGGAKVAAYVNLVNRLKSRGVKITQVGSQSHLIAGSTPSASSLASVFSSLVATGVDVAITELDIRMTLPATAALLAQQKKDYNAVILACMQTPRCVGVTIWAYSDFYSWIPGVFPGWGGALPWDEQLEPKPAFNGIADGINSIVD